MNEYAIVAWCIIACIVAAVLPYLIGARALRRKKLKERVRLKARRDRLPIDAAAREVATEDALPYIHCTGAEKLYRFDKYGHKIDTDTGTEVVERVVGKHPALGAGYARPTYGKIVLTRRQLEGVNIRRKLAGKSPLTRAGFKSAIAHPWDRDDVRQPRSTSDWLTYLIVYEVLLSDHMTARTSVDTSGIMIDPDAPYNGQGGEFGGAGASGDWTSPSAQALAAASLTTAAAVTAAGGDPLSDPNSPIGPGGIDMTMPGGSSPYNPSSPDYGISSQAPLDTAPSYSVPDTSPSYSAPDPSPSFDSSSSSVDTSSF